MSEEIKTVEQIEKRSFFAQIPSVVLSDSRLTPLAKLVYGEIFALANESGQCYPSNTYLAELLGVGARQISRCISSLVELELIECFIENFNSRTIRISFTGIDRKFLGDRQKLRGGTSGMSTKKNIEKNSIDKKEIYKEKVEVNILDYLLNVPYSDLDEIANRLNVSHTKVKETAEKIHDHILSTGVKYKDPAATIRNWIRRDLDKTNPRKEVPVFANIYSDNPTDA